MVMSVRPVLIPPFTLHVVRSGFVHFPVANLLPDNDTLPPCSAGFVIPIRFA